MDDEGDLIYLAAGPLAAVFLGLGLFPLRGLTPASNFAFAFMALTIAVAEFGGRRAAVVTALCAALSLDFFLTQPYLRLTIDDKHDVAAFAGLAICGLVAAAFGTQRSHRTADLVRANAHLDLLHESLRRVEEAGPPEAALLPIVRTIRTTLPVSAVVVRDETGRVLASSERGATPPGATQAMTRDSGRPAGEVGFDPRPRPFPPEGARIEVFFANRRVGLLEVWGDGTPARERDRTTLVDLARIVGSIVAGHGGADAG